MQGEQSESAGQSVQGRAKTAPRRPISRKKKWLFRLLAVGFAVLLVALFEAVLRIAGAGSDLSLVVPVGGEADAGMYRLNPAVDRAYFRRTRLQGPEARHFALPKPDGVYRIVVAGASSVVGFPYPFELSFPRHLEVMLSDRFPGRRFEVLNAGITALNSFSVADVVRQSLDADPDLIVVYCGHNEFYGPGGAASSAPGFSVALYPWVTAARRLRTTQILFGWFEPEPTSDDLMKILPATLEIPFDGEIMKRAEADYRANLSRMVAAAGAADVPIILCSVACNLRNQSPIRAPIPSGLSEADTGQWVEAFEAGEAASAAGDDELAIAHFSEASAIHSDHAILQYRLGQSYERLQRWEESRRAFSLARDFDTCRFRAPSTFRDIVKQVVAAAHDDRVYFSDIESAFAAASSPAAPGDNLFLEHVHPTQEGHALIAATLAEQIARRVLGLSWPADSPLSEERRNELLSLIPEDLLAADSFALQVVSSPPMNEAFDSSIHAARLTARISERYGDIPEEDRAAFEDLSMQEIAERLLPALAERLRKAGHVRRANELMKKHCARRPWECSEKSH